MTNYQWSARAGHSAARADLLNFGICNLDFYLYAFF